MWTESGVVRAVLIEVKRLIENAIAAKPDGIVVSLANTGGGNTEATGALTYVGADRHGLRRAAVRDGEPGVLLHLARRQLILGVADQRPLAGRADVHVAMRTALERDTLLAGPLTARLVTAADGDDEHDRLWVAAFCVQQADGALHNLAEGVAATPPQAERVEVELGDTLAWLPAGSLLVAGSSFPRWPKPLASGRQRLLDGAALELTVAPVSVLSTAGAV
jgi:hypothetical protein